MARPSQLGPAAAGPTFFGWHEPQQQQGAGDRYWVAGAGTWDQTSTAHWSTFSGGPGGASVPNATSNVFFDANSGAGTVALTVSASCRSLQTNTPGSVSTVKTLTHGVSVTLTIGDSTAGANGIALDLGGLTTYTIGGGVSSAIVFASTAATQQTVNYAGLGPFGSQTYSGAASSYLLTASLTSNAGTLAVTAGTFASGGFSISMAALTMLGATTRTVDITNSTVTLSNAGNGAFDANSATNLTFIATGSTIVMTGAGNANTFRPTAAGLTFGTVRLTGAGTSGVSQGANSFVNFERSNAAACSVSFPDATTQTFTNPPTLSGAPSAPVTVNCATAAGTATLSVTNGPVVLDYVIVRDIAATGAAGRWTAGPHSTNLAHTSGIDFQSTLARFALPQRLGPRAAGPTFFAAHPAPANPAAAGGAVANQSALTAVLTFTGAQAQAASTLLAAALTFTGAQARALAKLLTATLTFTGALTRRTVKLVAAVLSFTGAQTRALGKLLAAVLTFTGAQARAPAKLLAAAVTFTGAQTRRVALLRGAAVTFTGANLRRTSTLLAGALTFTGGFVAQAVHFFTQALPATLTLTGASTRRTGKLLAAAVTLTGAGARRTGKLLAAAAAFTGAQSRRTGKALAAAVSSGGAVGRRIGKLITGALTAAGGFIAAKIGAGGTEARCALSDAAVTPVALSEFTLTGCAVKDAATAPAALTDKALTATVLSDGPTAPVTLSDAPVNPG